MDVGWSAEALSSVPKPKNSVMCLTEKVPVLEELHSRMRYSAVGPELQVNGSTVYIKLGVFMQKQA